MYYKYSRHLLVTIYTMASLFFTINYALDGGFDVWENNLLNLYLLIFPGIIATITCFSISKFTHSSGMHNYAIRTKSKKKYILSILKYNIKENFPLILGSLLILLFFSYLTGPLGFNSYEPTRYNIAGELIKSPDYGKIMGSQLLSPIFTAILWSFYLLFWGIIISIFSTLIELFLQNNIKTIAVVQIFFLLNTFVLAILGLPQLSFLYSMAPFGLQISTAASTLIGLFIFLIICIGLFTWVWRKIYEI